MNEEEIIKKIKELLYNPDFDYILLKDEEGFTTWHTVFEGLLNLYKQEKEKNKDLEEKLKIAKQFYNDACVCIATDCVEKDKIKELLENEIIDISGFRCIAVEDIENLLEEK